MRPSDLRSISRQPVVAVGIAIRNAGFAVDRAFQRLDRAVSVVGIDKEARVVEAGLAFHEAGKRLVVAISGDPEVPGCNPERLKFLGVFASQFLPTVSSASCGSCREAIIAENREHLLALFLGHISSGLLASDPGKLRAIGIVVKAQLLLSDVDCSDQASHAMSSLGRDWGAEEE